MSDEIANAVGAEPTVGSTEGYGESTGQVSEPILSVDDYSTYKVPVKIDGEEQYIPLTEAISGYQRQADYTRKTQELAQQREQMQFASALQTALERDPAATIDLLSRHYGISRQAAANMVDSMDIEPEELDPVEARYRQLDNRIAQFEELQAQQQIEKEISRLQDKYPDFDPSEVVTTALRLDTTDLEAVYKQIAFDKIMQQVEIRRQAEAQQASREQQVVDAKRTAAVVSGGASASGAGVIPQAEPVRSIRDAWAAAKEQLNANF
jgi:Fe-S-cluster formation regulator IscX/YfhJ